MSTLLERSLRGETLADLEIVDMHGHLGRYDFLIPDLSAAGLVATMDRLGVRSVICSHMQCMSADMSGGNREVLDAMQAFPGRILGYVALWPADPQAARAEAEACFRNGFVGLKLHNTNGFAYTDAAYAPALEMADERQALLLLHTWGKEEEFAQVRQLAERYPRLAILLGHSGAANENQYTLLAREFENVYLDLTKSLGPRGQVERLVAGAGADKVVWGSDIYFLNMAHQLGKVLGSRLADQDKIKVLSGNARRLLSGVAQVL